jgi:DNA-binding transcriptional LysR family regulator
MNIDTFKVFCDLAETCSFSKAAKINSITQSAVSQQIRALEIKYQAVLIERGRRNFSLTPEGQAFLDASREILNVYNNLDDRRARTAQRHRRRGENLIRVQHRPARPAAVFEGIPQPASRA